MVRAQTGLLSLDEDALTQIILEMHHHRVGARHFSVICRRIRHPYIRTLMFLVPDPPRHRHSEWVLPLENNRFRIKSPLADMLSHMPKLRTLRHVQIHGVLWDTRAETLPRKLPLKVAPLTSLYLRRTDFRFPPRAAQREDVRVLAALLSHVHSSLETLHLPSELISLEALREYDWPRLRELRLRGERQSNPAIAVLPTLSDMRTLRTLKLELAQTEDHGSERQSMGPCGDTSGHCFPWRDLEILTVSYPHPEDECYQSLPSTLRRLDLRCWPRHYLHILPHDRRSITDVLKWHSPILASSEMLDILRRCRTSDAWSILRQLDLEFREDHMDPALFRQPRQLERPGGKQAETVPFEEHAEALAPLTKLRVLRLHLDFREAPHPFAKYDVSDGVRVDPFDAINRTIAAAADSFARAIESLRHVCFLSRRGYMNHWLPYRVLREDMSACSNCVALKSHSLL
ncbi:hypothetical protein C8Q80DRAFT_1268740 [Daedaleopsis nitida]|nr:hypothetical protein C8Q80DRAFT_1268740 [Daedaleopsis nitida]